LRPRKADIPTASVGRLGQAGVGNDFAVVNPSHALIIVVSVSFLFVSLFSLVSSLCLPVAVALAFVRLVLVAMFVVAIAGLSFFSIASRGRSTNLGSTRTKTYM
jgi:hypothetical protein